MTIIPSWVWWKPVLTTFNAAACIGLAIWLETILLDIFLPKEDELPLRKEEETQVGGN